MDKMNICHDTDEADETLNSDQIKGTLQKYAAQTERMIEMNKKSTKRYSASKPNYCLFELTALLLINT